MGVTVEVAVEDIGPVVEEVVCDVLSSMCFAAPEFLGEGVIRQPIASAIRFSGEITGELRVALGEGLAKQLAADFLGMEPSAVSLGSASEFALELANVLCGVALTALAREHEYEVALPSLLEGIEAQPMSFVSPRKAAIPMWA